MQKLRTKYSLSRGTNSQNPTPPPSVHSHQEYQTNLPKQGVTTNYSQHNSNKSHHSHHSNENPFESNLLCQNCINQYLIDLKNKRITDQDYQFTPFEDKMKNRSQQAIQSKVRSREAQSALAGDALTHFNSQAKNNFILQQENNSNPLNDQNNNYLYERALQKQAAREKLINANIDKFKSNERPEITSYYKHYVDKEQPDNNRLFTDYQNNENRKTQEYQQYKNDLLKQIAYKDELKRKQFEEDAKRERDSYNKAIQDEQKANEERYLKDRAKMEELRDYNLGLMRQKDLQRMKEKEEDEMYNERYRKECEDAKRKEEERIVNEKLKREMFLKDNLNYIERDRNKRLKERNEDLNYEYRDNICCHDPEEMGKCMKCQKVFPRRLLTINRNFYTNNRKGI